MSEFPKLMWSPQGQEVTVKDATEQETKTSEGFKLHAPGTPEPVEAEPEAEKPKAKKKKKDEDE